MTTNRVDRLRVQWIFIAATCLSAKDGMAQCSDQEQQKILPSEASGFGSAISISGNVAVVGASYDGGSAVKAGSAHVYRFDGSQWVEQQELTASNAAPYDRFGASVGISADVIIVGAFGDDDAGESCGSSYVFRFDGSQWMQEQKLTAVDGGLEDFFGYSVDISGDHAIVGALGDNLDDVTPDAGSAYLFRFDGSQWTLVTKLLAGNPESGAFFGNSVAIDGHVAVVGARWEDDQVADAGAAYVFRYDGSQWKEEQRLGASDPDWYQAFGWSVAIDQPLVVIGAIGNPYSSPQHSAYVFRFNGANWFEEQALPYSLHFPRTVAVDKDKLVVGNGGLWWGTYGHPYYIPGYGQVFRFDGSRWITQQVLTFDYSWDDYFGAPVAIDGGVAMVGTAEHGEVSASEAAYVYLVSELALEIMPSQVSAGDMLYFTTCGGLSSQLALLAIVEVNNLPLFVPITLGTFDGGGQWSFTAIVPPGLQGLVAEFQSFGFYSSGRAGLSDRELIEFQ